MRTALIAGTGGLPRRLAAALGRDDLQVIHPEGFAPDGIASEPFRVERLGTVIAALREAGVGRVCFAGAMARPRLDPAAVDAATTPLVPRMMAALRAGDDAALRTVIGFFEEAGIGVVAAQDLDPTLLDVPEIGMPSERDRADIARARQVHEVLGPLDVGQGIVVAGGQVLAIEAMPGTDWMLRSLARFPGKPEGGVLFKAAKPGQDTRIDMATIGPDSVDRAADAGLAGIAVARGAAIVLESRAVRARAALRGLFVAVT